MIAAEMTAAVRSGMVLAMEDFGVGGAAKMALHLFEHASRGSGRTTRLVDRVQPGDRIIVATAPERIRLERLLRDAGKDGVAVRVCSPANDDQAWRLGTNSTGVTLFETSWVEAWYRDRVERAQRDLAQLQEALSKDRQAPAPIDYHSYRFERYR